MTQQFIPETRKLFLVDLAEHWPKRPLSEHYDMPRAIIVAWSVGPEGVWPITSHGRPGNQGYFIYDPDLKTYRDDRGVKVHEDTIRGVLAVE